MTNAERLEIAKAVARLHKDGADTEAVLSFMRKNGFGIADSLQTLERVTRIDHAKAWFALVKSKTWVDQRDNMIQLQEDVIAALQEIAAEEDPDIKITVDFQYDDDEETE